MLSTDKKNPEFFGIWTMYQRRLERILESTWRTGPTTTRLSEDGESGQPPIYTASDNHRAGSILDFLFGAGSSNRASSPSLYAQGEHDNLSTRIKPQQVHCLCPKRLGRNQSRSSGYHEAVSNRHLLLTSRTVRRKADHNTSQWRCKTRECITLWHRSDQCRMTSGRCPAAAMSDVFAIRNTELM
jgi:hypothetical protein